MPFRSSLFILCLFAANAVGQKVQAWQRHVMYLLAGQSNIEFLVNAAPGCVAPLVRTNVAYFGLGGVRGGFDPLQLIGPYSNLPPMPITELGERLGRLHDDAVVEIVLLARSGSALLARNSGAFVTRNETWVDPAVPSNPSTLINRMAPALAALALHHPDELHIVWGQGESDCSPLLRRMTGAGEYEVEAQLLFARMAQMVGVRRYDVHLVTPGSILSPSQPDDRVDQIREAFFRMSHAPLAINGCTVHINAVAHQYDIGHPLTVFGGADIYHLDGCGYAQLARRIGEGIANPASLPRVLDAIEVVSPTRLQVRTTVPLLPFPSTTAYNQYFAVEVGGLRVSQFQVEVAATKIGIDVPPLPYPLPPLCVRYVAGSGYAAGWPSSPIATPDGKPLEPFVLRR